MGLIDIEHWPCRKRVEKSLVCRLIESRQLFLERKHVREVHMKTEALTAHRLQALVADPVGHMLIHGPCFERVTEFLLAL